MARRRRFRRLLFLSGAIGALAWWRQKKLTENERQYGRPPGPPPAP